MQKKNKFEMPKCKGWMQMCAEKFVRTEKTFIISAAAVPLQPLGIVCGQFEPDPNTMLYPAFGSSFELCQHIANRHPDPGGVIFINWSADSDNMEDESDVSDD